jgi:hypothetical protein
MSGLSSPQLQQNTEVSCCKASLHNAASHNYPTFPPPFETLLRSTSYRPSPARSHTRYFVLWTPPRFVKQHKSVGNGELWQMMMWCGTRCASNISRRNARSVDGVYHYWNESDCATTNVNSNYGQRLED